MCFKKNKWGTGGEDRIRSGKDQILKKKEVRVEWIFDGSKKELCRLREKLRSMVTFYLLSNLNSYDIKSVCQYQQRCL